jgi:integrase
VLINVVDRAMAGKQAKILSDDHVRDLSYASCTRHPCRNEVLVLLLTKAGLRAGEIANLTWDMVADPIGQIGDGIALWIVRRSAVAADSSHCIPSSELR